MEIHGTVYFETQRPPEVPAFVKNHGLLAQAELQQLLRRAKVGGMSVTFRGSVMKITFMIIITSYLSTCLDQVAQTQVFLLHICFPLSSCLLDSASPMKAPPL